MPTTSKAAARPGSTNSQTFVVAAANAEPRRGSAAELILAHFKTPTAPVDALDAMVAEWRVRRKRSRSFTRRPRAYVSWHVLDLVRSGRLTRVGQCATQTWPGLWSDRKPARKDIP